MKKKFLSVFFSVFAVIMLITSMIGTVMAIGPQKASEIGKNPNLDENVPPGVAFLDDVGPNNIMWINAFNLIICMSDARKGSGRMNNALIVDHDTLVDMQTNPQLYDNMWVYLSGTGGEQWNGHGMLYWSLLPVFGPIAAAELEQEYSEGAFRTAHQVSN